MNIIEQAWQHLHDHFVPVASNNYKPHVIGHKSLHMYAGFLISVKMATLFSLNVIPENKAYSSAITISNIIELTNASRSGYSLGALQENNMLDAAAQTKAEDMLKNQYFAHNSPQGKTPWDFISAQHYNYIIAGENLAINFSSAESVEDAWMNSPGHKANILNKDFQDIGIGITQGSYNGINAIFVVQMFGTRLDQPLLPKNAFTTPQPKVEIPPNPVILKSALPKVRLISVSKLSKPVLQDVGYYLTSKKDVIVRGNAPGAKYVSLQLNGQPVELVPVINDTFAGTLILAEGENSITALSTSKNADSVISNELKLKLDTSMPAINNTKIVPVDSVAQPGTYRVEAEVLGNPVKVLASYGSGSIWLSPTATPNLWQGILVAKQSIGNVSLAAYNMVGNKAISQIAGFSNSLLGTYAFAAQKDYQLNFFGKNISTNLVHNVYLYFALGIISAMLFTIAIKRKIYHVALYAHASAMVVVAIFFWAT